MTTTTTPTPHQRLTIVKHLAGGKSLDTVATITRLSRDEVLDIASDHGYPKVESLKTAAGILERRLEEDQAAAAISTATKSPSGVDLTGRPPATTPTRVATAAAPADAHVSGTGKPDEFRVLINTAKGMGSKRIQTLANRILDDTAKLRGLIQAEQDKTAARQAKDRKRKEARAEVERLEKQLREARARLRGTPTTKQASSTGTTRSAGSSTLTEMRARIAEVLDRHQVTSKQVRAWAAANDIVCPATGMLPARVVDAYDQAHPETGDAA